MQRTLAFVTGAVIAALLLTGCGKTYPVGATAPTPPPIVPTITSLYTIPTNSALPQGLVSTSNQIWFTEQNGNNIGALSENATFNEIPLPNAGSGPYGIVVGPDGYIWFTEYSGNRIGRYNPFTKTFAEFTIPTSGADPISIVVGSDGALWFTEYGTARIGRVTLAGSVTDYAVGGSKPLNAVLGPDDAVWFTLEGSNQIGTITPTDVVTLYTVPTASSQPYDIVKGADGALWFTEHATGKLGRITVNNGTFSEVSLTGCAAPGALQLGIDGNFYIFCTGASPAIVQYNPQTTKMKTFALKAGSAPDYATIAIFDNKIYFTDSGLNDIAQFTYE